MKWICILILSVVLATSGYAGISSEEGRSPFGDTCPLCGEYGYCTEPPSHKAAIHVLATHYAKRGLHVVVVKEKGRFLEAEVYRKRELVDKVLLDLRTGRIRSIN